MFYGQAKLLFLYYCFFEFALITANYHNKDLETQ